MLYYGVLTSPGLPDTSLQQHRASKFANVSIKRLHLLELLVFLLNRFTCFYQKDVPHSFLIQKQNEKKITASIRNHWLCHVRLSADRFFGQHGDNKP